MNDDSVVWPLFAHFSLLSILAIGGMNVVLPDAHRFVVDLHPWLTDQEFADFFAIAQAAPGPNMLIFSLIGWKLAGVSGAVAATAGITGPCSILAYVIGGVWRRFRDANWRRAIQAGMAPITIGLVLATAYVLSGGADTGWVNFAITAATAILTLSTKLNPLWIFLVVGCLGLLGLTS